jgi:hypothetical protein
MMIVRRMLGMLGCAPQPDADAVQIAVLRHQWQFYVGRWLSLGTRQQIG